MINEILQFSRKRSKVVGNIGNVAIEAVMTDRIKSTYEQSEYFVLEISSYQLFTTRLFKPYIAILLNITPDHIN
jgi:UDP-N-acetylmuramoylalanine--D-glutamate ligase